MLHEVEWYKDRKLHGISLGGVLCLVFIRMIQHNIFKMRASSLALYEYYMCFDSVKLCEES